MNKYSANQCTAKVVVHCSMDVSLVSRTEVWGGGSTPLQKIFDVIMLKRYTFNNYLVLIYNSLTFL